MNRIYGTIFNNRKYLPGVMASLKGLRPYKVYVVDNFSTDDSYEYMTHQARKRASFHSVY